MHNLIIDTNCNIFPLILPILSCNRLYYILHLFFHIQFVHSIYYSVCYPSYYWTVSIFTSDFPASHSYLPQLMAMKEFMISFSRVFLRGATTCNSFETGISSCTHRLRLTTLDSIVTPSFTLHIDRHSCVSKDYSSIPINFQLP